MNTADTPMPVTRPGRVDHAARMVEKRYNSRTASLIEPNAAHHPLASREKRGEASRVHALVGRLVSEPVTASSSPFNLVNLPYTQQLPELSSQYQTPSITVIWW